MSYIGGSTALHCDNPTDCNSNSKFREMAIVKGWIVAVELRLCIPENKFQFDQKGQEILLKLAKKY